MDGHCGSELKISNTDAAYTAWFGLFVKLKQIKCQYTEQDVLQYYSLCVFAAVFSQKFDFSS